MNARAAVKKLFSPSTPLEAASAALAESTRDHDAARAKFDALQVGTAEILRAARSRFDADDSDANGAALCDVERLAELRVQKAQQGVTEAAERQVAAADAVRTAKRDAAQAVLDGNYAAVAALAHEAAKPLAALLALAEQRDALVEQGLVAAKLLNELDDTAPEMRHAKVNSARFAGSAFSTTIKNALGLGDWRRLLDALGGDVPHRAAPARGSR